MGIYPSVSVATRSTRFPDDFQRYRPNVPMASNEQRGVSGTVARAIAIPAGRVG
jgi:hypothetical protein